MASRLTLKFEIPGVKEPVLASGIVKHRGKHREGFGIQFEKDAEYIIRVQLKSCQDFI